tara:strand:- start:241 stop:1347 length:1107 start_codon:yes stop_codon:yes gene_type:complete
MTASKRKRITVDELDAHGEVAANLAKQWKSQHEEKLDTNYKLDLLKPSPSNPRRMSLDNAGATLAVISSLALKTGEDVDDWIERLDSHLSAISNEEGVLPAVILTWTELITMSMSIQKRGLLQPIVANMQGEIIGGERRWLSSILAGKVTDKVIFRKVSASDEVILRFIENMQRSDLAFAEIVGGLRQATQEATGEPCGPKNKGIKIKLMQELLGMSTTQSALYRSYCKLPDGDPVLKKILSGAYTDKQLAYEDAQARLNAIRAAPDEDDANNSQQLTPTVQSKPADQERGKAVRAKAAAVKVHLPNVNGAKAFFNAVRTAPGLNDALKERIDLVGEQWGEADEKGRKKMLGELLSNIFENLESEGEA